MILWNATKRNFSFHPPGVAHTLGVLLNLKFIIAAATGNVLATYLENCGAYQSQMAAFY